MVIRDISPKEEYFQRMSSLPKKSLPKKMRGLSLCSYIFFLRLIIGYGDFSPFLSESLVELLMMTNIICIGQAGCLDIIFFAERAAVSFATLYFKFGFSICSLLAALLFVVINLTLLTQDRYALKDDEEYEDEKLKTETVKKKIDAEQASLKEVNSIEENDVNLQEPKSTIMETEFGTGTFGYEYDLSKLKDDEKKYKELPETTIEEFYDELCTHRLQNEHKEQCLQSLQAENEDLKSKLVAACESLEYYRKQEIENKSVVYELEETRLKWDEERNDLLMKLYAANSMFESCQRANYDYELYTHSLVEEINDLSAKLSRSNSLAEIFRACLDDCEEDWRKSLKENTNLSAKLLAETTSADHYYKLAKEMDEEYRKLQDEKNDIEAKYSAAKEALELYRRCFSL